MDRRSILRSVLGMAGASAAGVRPKDLIAASKAEPDLWNVALAEFDGPTQVSFGHSAWSERRQELMQNFYTHVNQLQARMPARIASKKSWSEAFKQMEWEREIKEAQEASAKLENYRRGKSILEAILGPEPD